MFELIAVLLIVMWLLGMVSSYTLARSFTFVRAGYRNGIDPSDSRTKGIVTGRNAHGSN